MELPLVDRTAESIVDFIKENRLEAGDKLPNEHDLALNLGVGRSTLREAVRSLVSRNILEVQQGSGTYVSKNIGIGEDPLGFSFVEDSLKLTEDLFSLRYILEPEVAMLAAQYRTDEEVEELERVHKELESKIDITDHKHFELDIEFHSIIAQMSRNIAMHHLIPVVNHSITLYNEYYTNEQSKAQTTESHQEIVDAIRDGNPIQAKYAMQMHIANNQRVLELNRKEKESAQIV